MKKTLSIILAVMMLLGCMSITAFADGKTMITEVNLTVGKTYTDLDTGVSVSVPGEADYTASYGGMEFVVGSDVYFYQITGGDSNLWLNMKSYTPCQTEPDVSNADKVFAVINLYTKDWQTYAFAENAGLTVTCNGRTINQKAQGASTEGWFSVSGISPQVYVDITPSKTSGTTDITAVKAAAPLSYEMVIPSAVNMTKAGIVEIGTPSVEDVKNATEKTVISYTASGTQLTLENSDKTMTTSYYTDSTGTTAMPSTAIEVYKNKDLVDPLTTLYVGVTESDWNAADAGTYKATVTFDFAAEEKEEKIDWVITFDGADLGSLEYWVPKSFTPATAEGATAETQYTYTIEGESSDFDIGYGQDIMTFAVLDSCPIECTQVTITVTFLEDATHKETSKSAVFTFNITG